jgi:WbqC-like protein family
MKIVISQPMYFPWVGMFEQIRLCDVYIHYDDVQFSKGSFTNRVQIKTNSSVGFNWLTVPLKSFKLGTYINKVEIDNDRNWQRQHLEVLKGMYKNALFRQDIIDIVSNLFEEQHTTISELSKRSIESIIDYFNLAVNKKFYVSSELNIDGSSSDRVYKIAKYFNGDCYITGHGAKKYLDHTLFDNNGIKVEYMDYLKLNYPQQYGVFNPYVSILDLIANTGKDGVQYIASSTKHWKDFLLLNSQNQ